MNRKLPLYIFAASALSGLLACNSSSSGDEFDTDFAYSNVMVKSFKLQRNDSVLANLDSVFFSIDLDAARIFNADSLPMGTKINRLLIELDLPMLHSSELIVPLGNGRDTTITYDSSASEQKDSIDFSNGPVTLRLVSYDQTVTRDYKISVNVHKTLPDSLAWGNMAMSALPTRLARVSDSKTVEFGGNVLCFTTDGSAANRAVTVNPGSDAWTIETVTLPAGAKVSSMASTDDAVYVIAADNMLFRSTDGGSTWSNTGVSMTHLYCGYGDRLLGVTRNAAGEYVHVTYPSTGEKPLPKNCPVSGTSTAVVFTSDWTTQPMVLVMGGVMASGELSGSTWGYDGSVWANVSNNPVPGYEGMCLVPYFTFRTNNQWVVTERTALFAFGGRDAKGQCENNMYVSYDRGVTWSEAKGTLRISSVVSKLYGAQAYVCSSTLPESRSAASMWRYYPAQELPVWCRVLAPDAAGSRAVTAITEWECPYIYMFGGRKSDGSYNNEIWRGVINRLTYKPLQ